MIITNVCACPPNSVEAKCIENPKSNSATFTKSSLSPGLTLKLRKEQVDRARTSLNPAEVEALCDVLFVMSTYGTHSSFFTIRTEHNVQITMSLDATLMPMNYMAFDITREELHFKIHLDAGDFRTLSDCLHEINNS